MWYVRGGAMIASKEVAHVHFAFERPARTADATGDSRDLDRQRHAKELAHLGCAGALGYGLMKVDWALAGTIGLRNPTHFHATENGLSAPGRFLDQWGSQILAGLAIVILLGLVYPWGNKRILRPLLRTLAWAGSLMAVVGLYGLILTIVYYAGDHGAVGLGDLHPGTFLFIYICFLTLDTRRGIRRNSLADPTATETLCAEKLDCRYPRAQHSHPPLRTCLPG
jgi:hypothetical protein